MKFTTIKNRITGKSVTVIAGNTGKWYGSSNRASDGSPIFEPVPFYRQSNPKIDMGDASGYIASTNHFRTIRDARQFYETREINGRTVTWMVRK